MFVTRLLIRLATAAVLIAALFGALFYLERLALSLAVALIVALGGYEWSRLSGALPLPSWMYASCCAILCFSAAQIGTAAVWVCALANIFWILLAPSFLARGFRPVPPSLKYSAGLLVLVPAGAAMTLLPPRMVLMVLGLVWVADTAAYLVGSRFGRRKLAPAISPGKTWEGAAGGAVASLMYAIILAMFTPDLGGRVEGVIWVPFLAGVLLLFVLSVVGDLFESALKRGAGAKDSGRLLPGHGGVLDRIDSATAVLPVAFLLAEALRAT